MQSKNFQMSIQRITDPVGWLNRKKDNYVVRRFNMFNR
jgi:hypothetical protein